VRSLTAELRDGNERYIDMNCGKSDSFAILMSVPMIKNKGMTPDFNHDGRSTISGHRGQRHDHY
jgi:hypothetical protein